MQVINVFNGNIENFIIRFKISDIDKIGFFDRIYTHVHWLNIY